MAPAPPSLRGSQAAGLAPDAGSAAAVPARVLILADDGDSRAQAEAGVSAARLATAAIVGWDDGVAECERHPGATLLLEAEGVADAALAAVLDHVAGEGDSFGPRLVVAFAPDQVDLVASALLGSEAQLLCRPTLADRVSALVLAHAAAPGRFYDPARGEATRLAAIAQEVSRIAEALGGVVRRDPAGTPPLADRRMSFEVQPDAAAPPVTAAEVRGAIRSRRLRDAEFGAGWFEEPAWDMLLDLFAAELEGTRVSVSSLCIAAAVAQTTALRWISKMMAAGLLVREDDASDRRRAFLTLSERAGAGLRRYCAAVRRAGLGIA